MEGFGLSTIESLACGTPVLGTPTGGTPEILRQISPDYILPGTRPEDIAAGIIAQLPHLSKLELRDEMRAFAETHSWKKIADPVEELFVRLVESK